MKKPFVFGAGVSASLVAWGVLAALANHHDVYLSRLLAFLMRGLLAWLFYSIGTIPFKRNASSTSTFFLGALSGFIQCAFIKVAIGRFNSFHKHCCRMRIFSSAYDDLRFLCSSCRPPKWAN